MPGEMARCSKINQPVDVRFAVHHVRLAIFLSERLSSRAPIGLRQGLNRSGLAALSPAAAKTDRALGLARSCGARYEISAHDYSRLITWARWKANTRYRLLSDADGVMSGAADSDFVASAVHLGCARAAQSYVEGHGTFFRWALRFIYREMQHQYSRQNRGSRKDGVEQCMTTEELDAIPVSAGAHENTNLEARLPYAQTREGRRYCV